MLSSKSILTALSVFAVANAATITVCSGSPDPDNGCVTFSIVSDSCVNLTGGLTPLNKAISNVHIPDGFVCTFFENFDCINGGTAGQDIAVLQGGDWNMFAVRGIATDQIFNDLTSSISCSPI